MHNFDDSRSDTALPDRTYCTNTGTKGKPFATTTSEPLLVIAGHLAEAHHRFIHVLREAFAVCGVTERKALERVMANFKPDVLVVDLALPGLRRVTDLRDIQLMCPTTKIVALTRAPAEDEGRAAVRSGAKGYCARTVEPEVLMRAVTAVQNGEIWASRKLVCAVVAELVSLIESHKNDDVQPMPDPRLEHLTERQRIVAVLISRGASNKEIGNRLNISERTVKSHLTEAFRNVGVSDRLQLALLLQRHRSVLGDV